MQRRNWASFLIAYAPMAAFALIAFVLFRGVGMAVCVFALGPIAAVLIDPAPRPSAEISRIHNWVVGIIVAGQSATAIIVYYVLSDAQGSQLTQDLLAIAQFRGGIEELAYQVSARNIDGLSEGLQRTVRRFGEDGVLAIHAGWFSGGIAFSGVLPALVFNSNFIPSRPIPEVLRRPAVVCILMVINFILMSWFFYLIFFSEYLWAARAYGVSHDIWIPIFAVIGWMLVYFVQFMLISMARYLAGKRPEPAAPPATPRRPPS